MPSEQAANVAAEHFKALFAETRKQLKSIQGTPIGTEPRSPQAQAALWAKLRALPAIEFNQAMDIAAEKNGHVTGEEKPCAVCSFVALHAAREGERST